MGAPGGQAFVLDAWILFRYLCSLVCKQSRDTLLSLPKSIVWNLPHLGIPLFSWLWNGESMGLQECAVRSHSQGRLFSEVFLILQSGEERSVNKSKFRTEKGQRQQWMGLMIKRPSILRMFCSRLYHLHCLSNRRWKLAPPISILNWLKLCNKKRCPIHLKESLHGLKVTMVCSCKNYTVSKEASCPVGAPALTSLQRRFQMEPDFSRVVFCSVMICGKAGVPM